MASLLVLVNISQAKLFDDDENTFMHKNSNEVRKMTKTALAERKAQREALLRKAEREEILQKFRRSLILHIIIYLNKYLHLSNLVDLGVL